MRLCSGNANSAAVTSASVMVSACGKATLAFAISSHEKVDASVGGRLMPACAIRSGTRMPAVPSLGARRVRIEWREERSVKREGRGARVGRRYVDMVVSRRAGKSTSRRRRRVARRATRGRTLPSGRSGAQPGGTRPASPSPRPGPAGRSRSRPPCWKRRRRRARETRASKERGGCCAKRQPADMGSRRG